MPMRGKDGIMKISQNVVGYIDNWSLTINRGSSEVSQIGKDYKEFIDTVKDASGSGSGSFDYGDTAQKSIMDKFLAGNIAGVVPIKLVTNEALELAFNAIITSVALGATHADKVTFSFNFQVTGDISPVATGGGE